MKPKHFLDIDHCDGATLEALIADARAMKARRAPKPPRPRERLLDGAVLAMLFEKPSTRTRFSFDVAMRELGGETLVVNRSDMQLGRGETIADTARVLSRYVDAIMLRTTDHDQLLELARHATVPVINGLSNYSHPCQIVADLVTFVEHRGPLAGKTVAWVGDCNNVAASWVHAALRLGFDLRIATPEALPPPDRLRAFVAANHKPKRQQGSVVFGHDPQSAAQGADCLVTDTWVSMGDNDIERRCAALRPYQVDTALMALAKPDAIFMHCLPASRGQEVAAEVIDGPQSVVFDEAENRLHAQKAILAYCLGGGD